MIDFDKIFENIMSFFKFNKIFSLLAAAFSIIALISVITTNLSESQKAEYYYDAWYEQLPANDPIKESNYSISTLLKTETVLNLIGGSSLDTSEEIVKYELSKIDVSNLGLLEKYISKKFDEAHPTYLLIDQYTSESQDKISLEEKKSKYLKLYRNNEDLTFYYESLFSDTAFLSKNDINNLDFVKAYFTDSDVAKIENNMITGISKGETILILIYKTELLEVPVTVE